MFHEMAPYGTKYLFEKMNLDYFPVRVFLDFPKMGAGASGNKKKDRRRVRSGKNTKNDV